MASAKATTDRNEIRRWVEERSGFPAHVKRTEGGDDPGILRIDYPGYSGAESLERIKWAQWFEWFDRDNLAFLYQPEGSSRFSKLVDRNSVEVSASAGSQSRGSSRKRSSSKKASSKKRSSKRAPSKKRASSKKAPAKRRSRR